MFTLTVVMSPPFFSAHSHEGYPGVDVFGLIFLLFWTRRHKTQLSALNPSTREFEAENNQARLTRPHLR
jgi:hypothetical protein